MARNLGRGRVTAGIATLALALGGAVGLAISTSSVSAAGNVSPTTNADDGSAGSLRFILEHLADATTTVVLPAGSGPYLLTDCPNGEININDVVVIEGNGNTIQQTCPQALNDGVLQTDSNLTLRNTTITGGNNTDEGGGILFEADAGTLTIEGSNISGNQSNDDGAGIMNNAAAPSTVTIRNTTVSNNTAGDDGGGYDNEGDAGTLLVVGSTFSGNTSGDLGGAIATEEDGTPFTIVNSTITANTSGTDGAISNSEGDGDDVTLVYDTITNNINNLLGGGGLIAQINADHGDAPRVQPEGVGDPATLTVDGQFTTFGTIITGPVNGPNCDLSDATGTTSLGYNFSDDATCNLNGTGDRPTAGSPGLGALANNGGPTLTQLPGATSPVLNFIPLAACGGGNAAAGFAVTTDQRGITRPQGTGCEEGSVEIPVIARFTG